MAVSSTDKIDFLWKKVLFGVSKTATDVNKAGSNETIASPITILASNIWTKTDSASIPLTPPVSSTDVVAVHTGANRIRMTNDTTSAPNIAWLATSTFGNAATRMIDFIAPTFGASYAVEVFVGDPNGSKAAKITPDVPNEEFVFDYSAGVLYFTNNIPANKTATIGTGTVSVATDGVYIRVYRYAGPKGVAAAGTTSKNTVVANIAARDALVGLVAGDIVHVLDASGIPTDASAGEYANYMWTGSAFSLISTQDSARTDALTTSLVFGSESSSTTTLGKIGNGGRVVMISFEVTSAFDGDKFVVVGDSGAPNRLVDEINVDLQTVGTYVVTPTYQFPAGQETTLVLSLFGSANVGEAKVTFTYA